MFLRSMGSMVIAGAGLLLEPALPESPETEAAQAPHTIIEAQYEPAYGNVGLPWGSAREIADGAWDGAFDSYDALDQIINGIRARSSYWRSTKDWVKGECMALLRRGGNPSWTGFCQDAAVSSWFLPFIGGGINIAGINFNEMDRKRIGALSYSGLSRDPEFDSAPKDLEAIKAEYDNGHCIAINRSPVVNQDWWGVVQNIEGDIFTISRPLSVGERGLQIERRRASTLYNVAVIKSTEVAHPKRDGNFSIINRDIGGLITGTRLLVAT